MSNYNEQLNAINSKLYATLSNLNDLPDNSEFEKGKQEAYDTFWDRFQNNGNARIYQYAFAYTSFNDETYNPKYPIIATATNTGSLGLFYSNEGITDTKVDITAGNSLQSAFYSCKNLKIIRKLIVTKACKYVTTFGGSEKLEYIRFEGEIGEDIAFNGCPLLTYESLMSIINHLYDYSGTTTTKTLTLGATNLAKLTDAEKAIATQRGWTLA